MEGGDEEDDAERERFSLATEYKLNEVTDSCLIDVCHAVNW